MATRLKKLQDKFLRMEDDSGSFDEDGGEESESTPSSSSFLLPPLPPSRAPETLGRKSQKQKKAASSRSKEGIDVALSRRQAILNEQYKTQFVPTGGKKTTVESHITVP